MTRRTFKYSQLCNLVQETFCVIPRNERVSYHAFDIESHSDHGVEIVSCRARESSQKSGSEWFI